MKYIIELKATTEYNAGEITNEAQKLLNESIGILEESKESAIEEAEKNLPCDEIGKYYTIETVEFCEKCGQIEEYCEC